MATRPEGFEELYNDERSRLERSTIRLAGDRAEDIVHDAFVTYLTRGSNVTFPKAWLGKVARNRALNDIRDRRTVSLDPDAEATPRLAVEPDPAPAERDAVRALVADALAGLDERSRLALRLRFFEERDYLEIASALECRVAQAHVVLHRSVKRLGRAILRRLAEAHGAGECIPALEELAGWGSRSNGHGRGACARCRPVLDELAALRSLGLLPVGLIPALRRFAAVAPDRAGEIVARTPMIEPAGQLAGAVLAIGLTVASVFTGTSSAATVQKPTRAEVVRSDATDARARVGARERDARRDPAGTRRAPAIDDGPATVIDTGPARVSRDDDHTQGEVTTDDGEPAGGVIVCEPFQPCPPPPGG